MRRRAAVIVVVLLVGAVMSGCAPRLPEGQVAGVNAENGVDEGRGWLWPRSRPGHYQSVTGHRPFRR